MGQIAFYNLKLKSFMEMTATDVLRSGSLAITDLSDEALRGF